MSVFRIGCRIAITIVVLLPFCLRSQAQLPLCGDARSPTKKFAARDELNKGVKAYKKASYDEAYCHFLRATEFDPELMMARSYLGFSLAERVVPNMDSPENLALAQQAIAVFSQVLEKNPHDINSLKQVAGIYFAVKKLDDARDWQIKVLAEDPKDPEAAYTIGVIDWTQAHQNALKTLNAAGLNDDGEGNTDASIAVLKAIRDQNSDLVEAGLRYLEQAIAIRPNYDDAMAYMNLLYRRKADLDFENPKARAEDVAMAREWSQKAMATRRANEEKHPGGASPAPN